jgi:hypothetical protein
MAQAAADARYAAHYRLAFDTYCMQHPQTYCRSGKSYAAHLTGLCCGVERGGDLALYTAIPRWLNGVVNVTRPDDLPLRGTMTVVDVAAARNVEEHATFVKAWAADVWAAYGPQHALAREWVGAALGETRDIRPRHPPPGR